MREIELTYQKNARDLGGLTGYNGLKVKKGRIFRGGQLSKVSPEDIEKINALHLTDIIDLRGEIEYKNHHDYVFDGVTYHNHQPLVEGVKQGNQKYEDGNLLWFLGSDEGFAHMVNVYIEVSTSKYGIEAYKNMFKILQQPDRRVYFHCSQGKDRAGMFAFFVLIALGVSFEDAKTDYLLSNVAMEKKIVQLKEMLGEEEYFDEEYERSLRDVFSAREEYLDAAVKAIKKEYGTLENYLVKALKVNLNKFRKLYLE